MNEATKNVGASGKRLPWHPAFYANIQIEFEDEASKLTFENEHHLGTQPKRIDVLIIKKACTKLMKPAKTKLQLMISLSHLSVAHSHES